MPLRTFFGYFFKKTPSTALEDALLTEQHYDEEKALASENKNENVSTRQASSYCKRIYPYLTIFCQNKNIVLATTLESTVLLGSSILATYYTSDKQPWALRYSGILLGCAIISVNLFLRVKFKREPSTEVPDEKIQQSHTPNAPNLEFIHFIFRSFLFSLHDYYYRAVMLHEIGHSIFIKLLYTNSNPSITFVPFDTSFTEKNFEGKPKLSEFGNYFGKAISNEVVSAAGTGIELIWVYISLITAQVIPDNAKELRFYLRLTALLSIANSVCYPLSATGNCEDLSNDFCNLKKHGVDPLIAAGVIVITPALLQLTLSGCAKVIKPCASNNFFQRKMNTSILVTEEKAEGQVQLTAKI